MSRRTRRHGGRERWVRRHGRRQRGRRAAGGRRQRRFPWWVRRVRRLGKIERDRLAVLHARTQRRARGCRWRMKARFYERVDHRVVVHARRHGRRWRGRLRRERRRHVKHAGPRAADALRVLAPVSQWASRINHTLHHAALVVPRVVQRAAPNDSVVVPSAVQTRKVAARPVVPDCKLASQKRSGRLTLVGALHQTRRRVTVVQLVPFVRRIRDVCFWGRRVWILTRLQLSRARQALLVAARSALHKAAPPRSRSALTRRETAVRLVWYGGWHRHHQRGVGEVSSIRVASKDREVPHHRPKQRQQKRPDEAAESTMVPVPAATVAPSSVKPRLSGPTVAPTAFS